MKFVPFNELEHDLLKSYEGSLPIPALIDRLVRSRVFALFDRELTGTDADTTASPLVFDNQSGLPLVAIFTHPDRATLWSKRFPQYEFGMLVDFQWLLRGVAPGVGIVINPGWEIGLEMETKGVEKLKNDVLEVGRSSNSPEKYL